MASLNKHIWIKKVELFDDCEAFYNRCLGKIYDGIYLVQFRLKYASISRQK